MPKAPRRKRIRAARTENGPTSRPAEAVNQQQSSNDASKKDAPASKKKATNGEGGKRDKELMPVIHKMTSATASERLWSLSAISHILGAADDGTRRALQSKNIVGLLIERLADSEPELRVEACGALRNLAIEGGFEVCAEMFNKSVVPALAKQLDPLRAALSGVTGTGSSAPSESDKRIRKLLWPWIENVATLFWCLAETSEKAFKAIVAFQPLSDLLYTVLRHTVPATDEAAGGKAQVPLNVALAAAQAVYVLTDTNVPSAPKFPLPQSSSLSAAHASTRALFMNILRQSGHAQVDGHGQSESRPSRQESAANFHVLCVGILQNLTHQTIAKKDSAHREESEEFNQIALRILLDNLQGIDLQQDAASVLEAYSTAPLPTKTVSAEAAAVSPQRLVLDQVDQRWTGVRLSLETLAEICAELDGIVDANLLEDTSFEEWDGIKGGDSEGNADLDDAMEEDHAHNTAFRQQNPEKLAGDALSLLSALPSQLSKLAQPTQISFAPTSALVHRQTSSETEHNSLLATQPEEAQDMQGLKYVPGFTEQVSSVHCRALECLNNLFITLARAGTSQSSQAAIDGGDASDVDMEDGLDADDTAASSDAGHDDRPMDDGDDSLPQEMLSDVFGEEGAGIASEGPSFVAQHTAAFQKVWQDLTSLLQHFATTIESRRTSVGNPATLDGTKSTKKTVPSGQASEAILEGVEAVLGCMWALGRLCVDQLNIGAGDHRLLLPFLENGLANSECMLRCVGALGCLAARRDVTVDENKTIGQALVTRLGQPVPNASVEETVEIQSQVLDTIFDVYADEERAYDKPAFVQLRFLPALQSSLPTFRQKTKAVDRRKHPEVRAQADAALTNLQEFIQYRRNLRS